jgi:4-hydroxy-tetrahydrodipicolinate synthase
MITGSIVALVTPMNVDGSVDWAALDRLLEWHIESGTGAIGAVGTTGESATLSTPEHCEVISHCVRTAAGRIPIVAGTGSNSTREALELTAAAAQAGADACLLVTPYYNKPSQRGMYEHYLTIAEAVDVPQILYNVPGRTAVDLANDTALRLADHDNIVGIKDATGDLERGAALVAAAPADFAVYSGDDPTAMGLILAGGKGNISVTANVAPAAMAELCALAAAGDRDGADAINQRLAALNAALFLEANPIPVKWALQRMGVIGEGIRLPLTVLEPTYHAQVDSALRAAGIDL